MTPTQQGNKYKSTQSLHDLGLDNYPNPEMPESSRLTRREEKQSLQNLNNRLAGMYHDERVYLLFICVVYSSYPSPKFKNWF